MSQNYALPSVENALILLTDLSPYEGVGIPPSVEKALEASLELKNQTVYLFFEPAEKEDDLLGWLEPWGEKVVTAALLPGKPADHLRGAMRRIFSRNDVRKAVAVFVHEQVAISAPMLRDAFAALDNAKVVVSTAGPLLGLTSLNDWVFASELWESKVLPEFFLSKAAERGIAFIDLSASKES